MLKDASEVLGPRAAAVCREITKKFEEVRQGTLDELQAHFEDRTVKGEIVVLVDRDRSEKGSELPLEEELKSVLASHSLRDAVDMVAQAHGVPRRQVYKLALEVSKG
jgi:16S rRNA (cytidine1402-2'-O)-methyltransferase